MQLRILVTGGTFDKTYDELNGRLFFKETHVLEILESGRCKIPVHVRTLMMIDSLEMVEEDREIILKNVNSCKEKHIIITHGTDTMTTTAEYLQGKVGDKTVVITGAMIPYKFDSSDGLFNLGAAVAFAQSLTPGVYVAMNGKCFQAGKVAKNIKTGTFEEIE